MLRAFRWSLLFFACAVMAQETVAPPTFHVVLGLDGAKNGANGTLAVNGGALVFTPSNAGAVKIPVAGIQDVSLGNDSKRTLSGVGQVTMLAPYGSGRVLSLFRDKLDVLTVAYRDNNGGLHGAVFTSKPGTAPPVKKALVAAGAKTSTPLEEGTPASAKGGSAEKVEPAGQKEKK